MAALTLALVAGLPDAFAIDRLWVGASGSRWDMPTNWDPAGLPQADDAARIVADATGELTVLYYGNPTVPAPLLDSLSMSGVGASGATLDHTLYAGDLRARNEYLGLSGGGARIVQSVGRNLLNDTLYLGYEPLSGGTYELGGSGQVLAYAQVIGEEGSGGFVQAGGTNTVTGQLTVGRSASPFIDFGNRYELQDGTLSAGTEVINNGTLVQSGGVNSTGSLQVLGPTFTQGLTADSAYLLEGGTLDAASQLHVYVEERWPASVPPPLARFVQTGGSATVGQTLRIGDAFGLGNALYHLEHALPAELPRPPALAPPAGQLLHLPGFCHQPPGDLQAHRGGAAPGAQAPRLQGLQRPAGTLPVCLPRLGRRGPARRLPAPQPHGDPGPRPDPG
jgi:hypothetical protein